MMVIGAESYRYSDNGHSRLWIKGWINMTDQQLQAALESRGFPTELRGNFSVIWMDHAGNSCLAVDHYATLPLFYTDSHVGQVFHCVKQASAQLTADQDCVNQMAFFGGMTVGPSTIYQEIKRVEPGHYVHNGISTSYLDILQLPLIAYDAELVRQSLIEICGELPAPAALMLSGGKDSATLCGVLEHLDKPCRYVTVRSPLQQFAEQQIVDRICAHHGIEYSSVEVTHSGAILSQELNERFLEFWPDNPFTAKREAMLRLGFGDHALITGEVGCGTYAVRSLLLYAAQKPGLTARQLCEYMVLDMAFYNKRHARDTDLIPKHHQKAFADLVDHYERKWQASSLPYLQKIVHLNTQDTSAFRMYAYSQDTDLTWHHPYADWRWVSNTIPIHASHKLTHRAEKWLYVDCFGDCITTIPWEYPKNGLAIPALSKY